jgi:dCMP deaminase
MEEPLTWVRPAKDEYFMEMALVVSTRATCQRRRVGCILTNARGHVLATGYNGNAAGLPHCLNKPCPGAFADPGTGLELCEAIHAEQNALLQCPNVYAITTAYVTVSPCVTCTKLLMNTSCERIVYLEPYAHDEAASELWRRAGRVWEKGHGIV